MGTGKDDASPKLDTLKMLWGGAYEIGLEGTCQWHADRRDGTGSRIVATDADGLHQAMSADYAKHPVSAH